MVNGNCKRIVVLLLCAGFSYLLSAAIRSTANGAMKAVDFGEIYYGARCAIEHKNPYDPHIALREFESDGGKFTTTYPKEARENRIIISVAVYPPTALFIAAPFARLPWPVALEVWLLLMGAFLVLASLLMWNMADKAPMVAGCMAGFILLNCTVLFVSGNPVGIVAPLCVIAAWCFLKERYARAGVMMLALSVAIKPHDAGFVWLYFLLAGGSGRKRAWQTLAVAALLGICAVVWIAPASPHWIAELHQNLAVVSSHGNTSDPGPSGPSFRTFSPIVSLQGAASLFSNDPRFYNPAAYSIAGVLILAWAIAVLRKRSTPQGALLALASISVLTLLPVYHRTDDAKLLLLVIPACAMLWVVKASSRWVALIVTSAAIVVTSAGPIILFNRATEKLVISGSTLMGKLILLLLMPASFVLLATACYYLWAYIRYDALSVPIANSSAADRLAHSAG